MTDAPRLSVSQIGAGIFVLLAGPALGSYFGSFTGTTGTVVGTAIGSVVIPAVLAWLFLRASYHARTRLSRVPWRKARPWQYAAAVVPVAALVFVVAMGGLSVVEASVLHKSLAAATTGHEQHGTTFGAVVGNAPATATPSPAATVVGPSAAITSPVPPASVSSSPVPSVSVTPSPVPSMVPSGIPSTPIPSQAPTPEGTQQP